MPQKSLWPLSVSSSYVCTLAPYSTFLMVKPFTRDLLPARCISSIAAPLHWCRTRSSRGRLASCSPPPGSDQTAGRPVSNKSTEQWLLWQCTAKCETHTPLSIRKKQEGDSCPLNEEAVQRLRIVLAGISLVLLCNWIRVLPISKRLQNASDTSEKAGISISQYVSAPIWYHGIY